MKTLYKPFLLLAIFFKQYQCGDLGKIFDEINKQTVKFNSLAAEIAWESSVDPSNPKLPGKAADYQEKRILWQHKLCGKLAGNGQLLNSSQQRQTYLLCRGPNYTFNEARETSKVYEQLQSIYTNSLICIPSTINSTDLPEVQTAILDYLSTVKKYLKNERLDHVSMAAKYAASNCKNQGLCLRGEPDLERIMTFSRDEEVLRWAWLAWREKVGPPMKRPYKKLVEIENLAARRNGYSDIGEAWRDELEIRNLRELCRRLYKDIQPLYQLLHGVTRFFLRRFYGDSVPETGPIPAHLLGNMWAENWESIADLMVPVTINLDESIKKLNWTVNDMVKRAEDFYQSLGLQPLPNKFWDNSIFQRANQSMRCHGTAAEMFNNDDVRLLYCSETTAEDFYVLHHELGHLHYFMAYKDQPGLFRQANTAFHESIGDVIMYGVMAPQHLHRLGLINDTILYASQTSDEHEIIDPFDTYTESIENDELRTESTNTNDLMEEIERHSNTDLRNIATKFKIKREQKKTEEFRTHDEESEITIDISPDEVVLLKQALNKLPKIPFSLLIDEYRWRYFEGDLDEDSLNEEFWKMAVEMQGVSPPDVRGEKYFDIGAKFHVPDNTPYIRYFLSSFIQHQLFEVLCKAVVYGHRDVKEPLPSTMPLHRCDIYGSKIAGKILKNFMSKGNSENWRDILRSATGQDKISASSLKRYYRPLIKLLVKLVQKYRIPIGW